MSPFIEGGSIRCPGAILFRAWWYFLEQGPEVLYLLSACLVRWSLVAPAPILVFPANGVFPFALCMGPQKGHSRAFVFRGGFIGSPQRRVLPWCYLCPRDTVSPSVHVFRQGCSTCLMEVWAGWAGCASLGKWRL